MTFSLGSTNTWTAVLGFLTGFFHFVYIRVLVCTWSHPLVVGKDAKLNICFDQVLQSLPTNLQMSMQLTKILDCMEKLTKWPWSNLEKQVTNIIDVVLWPWKCCVYQCFWNSNDTVLHKHHIVIYTCCCQGFPPYMMEGICFSVLDGQSSV